ncbi:MAG TPA: multiheme c-type cytochrome, partial [Burkholderiales bacterium]|nr:multiheme c-type cytochrome [Burkholderiales bacterium]
MNALVDGPAPGRCIRFGARLCLALCLIAAYAGEAGAQRKPRAAATAETADPHAKVLEDDKYPSAGKCKACHAQIYDEWRSSNHAYAGISPMFHKFEQKINELAPTIGAFCVRCHMGVGTAQGEDRALPLWKRSQVSREGVTCISCHRVNEEYSKVNGE